MDSVLVGVLSSFLGNNVTAVLFLLTTSVSLIGNKSGFSGGFSNLFCDNNFSASSTSSKGEPLNKVRFFESDDCLVL